MSTDRYLEIRLQPRPPLPGNGGWLFTTERVTQTEITEVGVAVIDSTDSYFEIDEDRARDICVRLGVPFPEA